MATKAETRRSNEIATDSVLTKANKSEPSAPKKATFNVMKSLELRKSKPFRAHGSP
jgi:hypothetical protein